MDEGFVWIGKEGGRMEFFSYVLFHMILINVLFIKFVLFAVLIQSLVCATQCGCR